MSVRKEQEILSQMLELADSYVKNGDVEKARRAMICAAAKILQIAESASPSVRRILEKRAYNIISDSVHITSRLLDNLITDIKNDSLGDGIDEVITKPLPRKKKKVMLDDVIGLDVVKDIINRQIIYPRKYADIYYRYNKQSGGGILMYGLPGTGKTMIAKAIANEIRANFIAIKCSDILSKWVGESEQNIKKLFNKASESKLSIIFFDEFEALACKRRDDAKFMNQLVPELLSEMQGFEENKNVIVICATNKPWSIDSAFLRPGRLTNRIYIDLPNKKNRRQLFASRLKDIPFDELEYLDDIADMTDGYSGADIDEVCEYAKNFAIDREIISGEESCLTIEDIKRAISYVKSSIRSEDVEEMEKYNRDNRYDYLMYGNDGMSARCKNTCQEECVQI